MNVVDANVIDSLRDKLDDDDILRASFVAFKEQLNSERKQLCDDIEVKDTHHLSKLVRRIKCEARQFGATSLADKCREVEASLNGHGSFNDSSFRGAQEVVNLMQSVENFIDTRFAVHQW